MKLVVKENPVMTWKDSCTLHFCKEKNKRNLAYFYETSTMFKGRLFSFVQSILEYVS